MRDLFGIAVAIVIAGLSQIVQPWSLWWDLGMAVAIIIAVGTGIDLLWKSARGHDRKAMTAADVGFWATVGATLVCAVYAALSFHKPKKQPSASGLVEVGEFSGVRALEEKNGAGRRTVVPLVAMFVALLAAIFAFADRHWFSIPSQTEQLLSADNGRIDVIKFQPVINPLKQFFLNLGLANNGKRTITEWIFNASSIAGVAGLADGDLLDALYIVLHRKIGTQAKTRMDFNPGQNDQFITIPNRPPIMQLDDSAMQAYRNGQFAIYDLLLLQYLDGSQPSGKFIYGERCVYVTQDVVHNCETHNHNYIAD